MPNIIREKQKTRSLLRVQKKKVLVILIVFSQLKIPIFKYHGPFTQAQREF